MAYKCKILEAVNLTLQGHYTYVCIISKVIGINVENKIVCQTHYTLMVIDDKE